MAAVVRAERAELSEQEGYCRHDVNLPVVRLLWVRFWLLAREQPLLAFLDSAHFKQAAAQVAGEVNPLLRVPQLSQQSGDVPRGEGHAALGREGSKAGATPIQPMHELAVEHSEGDLVDIR